MELHTKRFRELSLDELYAILRLRAEVFVVEQACAYQDPDDLDREAVHLLGVEEGGLVAYARWYREGEHVRLGRIVTSPRVRRRGHGRRLVTETLRRIVDEHPGVPVLVHAQAYLEDFYRAFGFERQGEAFEEDGIAHVAMFR